MNLFFGIKSFEKHTSNEGWQLQQALACNGFTLCGHGFYDDPDSLYNSTDIRYVMDALNDGNMDVDTVIVQDPREWIGWSSLNVKEERFTNYCHLKQLKHIKKVCVIKDAQHFSVQNRDFAEDVGIDTWIHYYSSEIVKQLNPWLCNQTLLRTYHSVNVDQVPLFNIDKLNRGFLSGARSSKWYPLRTKLFAFNNFKHIDSLRHPGYTAVGSYTPEYLRILNRYKVAICTASSLGYLLRKIVEATCCGCRVITNFTLQEQVPVIEANLVRVGDDISPEAVDDLVHILCSTYNHDTQRQQADEAIRYYNHTNQGLLLKNQIDSLT